MRFKIDQNLPSEYATLLRQAGFEADTVDDEDLGDADDLTISTQARTSGRAVVTLDLGFSDIRSYPPGQYSGIIVIRSKAQDKVTLISILRRLLLMLRDKSPDRQLWIVGPDRIRFRED